MPIAKAMAVPQLRIVVFPETTKAWTARCLEHDLAAGGRTADAAVDALLRITSAHIDFDIRHGRQPLSAFCAAPRPYWNAYAGASMLTKPVEVTNTERRGPLSCLITVARENPAIRRAASRIA
jgi:hypothetical protein